LKAFRKVEKAMGNGTVNNTGGTHTIYVEKGDYNYSFVSYVYGSGGFYGHINFTLNLTGYISSSSGDHVVEDDISTYPNISSTSPSVANFAFIFHSDVIISFSCLSFFIHPAAYDHRYLIRCFVLLFCFIISFLFHEASSFNSNISVSILNCIFSCDSSLSKSQEFFSISFGDWSFVNCFLNFLLFALFLIVFMRYIFQSYNGIFSYSC
jgi:uncharacterized membrane protein